jgi:hypothetical protein
MRRVRRDEVEDLVSGRPYVGGLRVGLLTFTLPLVNLYVSEDRLVLQPRFGLAWLWRPWVVDRADVAYIRAPASGWGLMAGVSIALEPKALLVFGPWRSSVEIVDRLRDLGYPCSPHEG